MTAMMSGTDVEATLDDEVGEETPAIALLVGLDNMPIPGCRKPIRLVTRGARVFMVGEVVWERIPDPAALVEVYTEFMEFVGSQDFDPPIPRGDSIKMYQTRIL